MNKYELLFIISSDTTDEQKESLIEKVKGMITSKNGAIEGVDKWGMRKLAYEINFRSEGYYVLINFSLDSERVVELTNQLNITEGVIRQMIVRR